MKKIFKNNIFKKHYIIINFFYLTIPLVLSLIFIYGDSGGLDWFLFIFGLFYGGFLGYFSKILYGFGADGMVVLSIFLFNLVYVFGFMKIIKLKRIVLIYVYSLINILVTLFFGYIIFGAIISI